jgi:hypothetical protein
MQILLWVLGGIWFISAVLFVLALAAAAGRRLSTSIKVATPASNRKRRLARVHPVPARPDAASAARTGQGEAPVLTAVSET